jgi:hypothetical protein
MGDLIIDARFHGDADFDSLHLGDSMDRYLKVKHSPTACAPCEGNEDVNLIPFPGCNGNISLIDPDEGIGNLCKCSVEVVTDHH